MDIPPISGTFCSKAKDKKKKEENSRQVKEAFKSIPNFPSHKMLFHPTLPLQDTPHAHLF